MNNQFYFTLPTTDKTITLPVEIKWDFAGRTESIELYEDEVLEEVIGLPGDFEVTRFAHAQYSPTDARTQINYKFNFYNLSPPSTVVVSTPSDWLNSYLPEGFTSEEVYYFRNSFTNSFFKLDFYDTDDVKNQTNYFTVIVPVQQGLTQNALISPNVSRNIKKPDFLLDFVGDKEGFFFYWLKDRTNLDITTFYMTAKFFDAKLGVFVKMTNRPQALIPGDRFNFDGKKYFYYKVQLDYNSKTYQVYKYPYNLSDRVGIIDLQGTTLPINWFEYVNP